MCLPLTAQNSVKKAYRRKALELHPDRNYGDAENATRRFAEIQSAYEILSDPQERAWYDSHREAILRGSDGPTSDHDQPVSNHVRLTTTDDILFLIRHFNASVPFTDEPTGFYGILNETFNNIAAEELAASSRELGEIPNYPTFGLSGDDFEAVVKPFYSGWSGFTTIKSFAWKDKYKLSDAPDRRVRRMMEKENKKLRETAAGEFNEAVRFLVGFVKKRDPRYVANWQSATERQESLRAAAAAQAARSRAANREQFGDQDVIPEWVQSRNEDDGDIVGHFSESETETEDEWIECVVCDKTFKSPKSFQAHERSKRHSKAVQQLRRQMAREGLELDLDQQPTKPEDPGSIERRGLGESASYVMEGEQCMTSISPACGAAERARSNTDGSHGSSDGVPDEGCYAPRNVVQQRIAPSASTKETLIQDSEEDVEDAGIHSAIQGLSLRENDECRGDRSAKQNKAKIKREKKAARKAAAVAEGVRMRIHMV